jgi:GNAT superfamily N-acetyltransferase
MMPTIHLRPVVAGDREFIASVYASTRTDELTTTEWTDAQKAEFCEMQFSAQDAHYRQYYPTADFQVIEINGIRAGRLYVDRWKEEIRIMDLVLLPEHCGKGSGTKLLLDLQQEAVACGKSLSIHVERFNSALRLYERLGFRMIEDKGVYLLLEWTVR